MSDDAWQGPERRSPRRRDDYAVVLRTLDTLEHTVSVLEQAVSTLQKAVTTLHETVFGREDPVSLKHVPGIRDRVGFHESLVRWVLIPAVIVAVGHDLGIPTDALGKLIFQHFGGP